MKAWEFSTGPSFMQKARERYSSLIGERYMHVARMHTHTHAHALKSCGVISKRLVISKWFLMTWSLGHHLLHVSFSFGIFAQVCAGRQALPLHHFCSVRLRQPAHLWSFYMKPPFEELRIDISDSDSVSIRSVQHTWSLKDGSRMPNNLHMHNNGEECGLKKSMRVGDEKLIYSK